MAPAMKTPSDERFAYAVLARQGAHVERRVPGGTLPRLEEIVGSRGELRVTLMFRRDDAGLAWVSGHAEQSVAAGCQRCLESFEYPLAVDFDLCILRESDEVDDIAEASDVLVAEGETVSIADIIEDEMLLALPERLCREDPCSYAPALVYPVTDRATDIAKAEESAGPFSVLAKLKRADS